MTPDEIKKDIEDKIKNSEIPEEMKARAIEDYNSVLKKIDDDPDLQRVMVILTKMFQSEFKIHIKQLGKKLDTDDEIFSFIMSFIVNLQANGFVLVNARNLFKPKK